MDQKATFLASEGDQYFRRNAQKFAHEHADAMTDPGSDPVLKVIEKIRPKSMLEVGCANGWRLDVANRLWGIEGFGVDPSGAAIKDGARFEGIELTHGTAVNLPDVRVDCVIFGCVLCWCDRADLFRIAAEADRVLNPGGHIIAYEFFSTIPRVRPYKHDSRIVTHKMDFGRLWSWHPAYTVWGHEMHVLDRSMTDDPEQWFATTVLRKAH